MVAEGERSEEPEKAAVQPKRKRLDWRYTATRRRKFITELATSYDPEAACRAAELDWPSVCRLRVLHPEFAAEWDEVIAAGYDRLELQLLRQAGAGSAAPLGKSEHELAAALLKQRRALKGDKGAGVRVSAAGTAGAGGAGGRRRKPPSQDQMLRVVMDRLEPLRRAAAARGDDDDGETGGAGSDGIGAGGIGADGIGADGRGGGAAGRDAAGHP